MPNDDVPPPVREIAGRFAQPEPMRRGSLSVRYVKCNKPGCACAVDPEARHGPYTSVVRTIGGRTRSRLVPAAQADVLRQQIEAGQHFRKDVGGLLAGLRTVGRRGIGLRRGELARGRQKKGLKEAFHAEIVAEIEGLIGPGVADALDFEAIETAARRQALAVAARAVEQRFNADTSDYSGPRMPCSCGQSARYAGRREKTFISVLGSVTFKRAYYHCEACRAGLCPRDRALGLEDGSLSPGVLRMVGQVGARVSFEEGHELLHELASVQLPTKHVERAAEALGREIAADERSFVELPAADETATPTLYLGMDGTGVPMRASEIKGRAGQAA